MGRTSLPVQIAWPGRLARSPAPHESPSHRALRRSAGHGPAPRQPMPPKSAPVL